MDYTDLYGLHGFRQMISRFGFPFLAKPFPPSVLRQRIEEMAAQPNLA